MTMEKHFHFIVPVWGKRFTQIFMDICLPLLTTKGNLPDLTLGPHDKFVIATTWADYKAIQKHPFYHKITEIIPFKFILMDGLVDLTNNYLAMSYGYAIAMRESDVIPQATYFVLLTPDSFWSEGTFKEIKRLRDNNCKVAMSIGLRVKSETIATALADIIGEHTEQPPKLPNETLIPLVMDHMHPMLYGLDMLSRNGFMADWPSHLYWINQEENQLIAHCFHLHPLMVEAPSTEIPIGTTIDAEFVKNLNYDYASFHVLQEDYFAVDLTATAREWETPLQKQSMDKIIYFSIHHFNSFHLYFFKYRINISCKRKVDPALETLISQTTKQILAKHVEKKYLYFWKPYFHLIKGMKQILPQNFKNVVKKLLRRTKLSTVVSNDK